MMEAQLSWAGEVIQVSDYFGVKGLTVNQSAHMKFSSPYLKVMDR